MMASWYRIRALVRKEFLQILRDPNTLALALLIPVVELFLLGYAATNDVRNVPIAVWDQDRGPAARALLDAYRAADYFRVAYEVASEDELQALIDAGEVRAALLIPPDYTNQIHTYGQAQVAFIIDGSDPTVATRSLSAAQLIGQHHATQIQTQRLRREGVPTGDPPLEVRPRVWFNPDLKDTYFMIPGLIGLILYALTPMLTASAIVRERERGTIEQLIVTPLRSWELVVGKIVPYIVIAFVDTLEGLLIGVLWFKIPIRSPLSTILLLSGLFLLSGLGIGLWASAQAKNQQEATLLVYMSFLPAIFLSGYIFPLQAMPRFLQIVSYFIPLRYFLIIIRALLIKGVPIQAVKTEVAALAFFGVFLLAMAALRFRKRLD